MARTKIEHIGIMVTDMERSIAFYRDVVGMTLKDSLTLNGGATKLAFMGFGQNPESEIELVWFAESHFPAEGRVHHLAITVDDIDEEYARIQKLGLEFKNKDIQTLPNGAKYFFFYGPDRESVEFMQPAAN
ncbi:VOC family protein [Xylanibacillus composti]|uniref:VOC domain-containing protein n=1 Tax=Xylanibacillus composti TaxID=1572762 RepID=A0A8J4M1E6_9BACL|nr:VOC family protein [Xylanibacillus composti]MDT9725667.1 VOC family protein [Xylanibacillus composti]GIQ67762.1 hypothetical protein XYCOK13_05860 [Xylanibacillus composti]